MHDLLRERVVYRDILKELFRPRRAVPVIMRRVKWHPKTWMTLNFPVVEDGEVRVAVVFHAFYMQDLPFYFSHLSRIPVTFDLLVSVPKSEDETYLRSILLDHNLNVNKVIVCVSENKGRNFAPFLIHFGKILINEYDVFLHIHTKRSDHSPHLKNWSDFLISNLLHSADSVDKIISTLVYSPSIALIHPTTYAHLGHISDSWDGNASLARIILEKLELPDITENFVFPAGGMFWSNVTSLAELLNYEWSYLDFSDEQSVDPELFQIPYVIERLISVIPILKGLKSVYLSSGQLTSDQSFVARSGVLDRFWDRILMRDLEK